VDARALIADILDEELGDTASASTIGCGGVNGIDGAAPTGDDADTGLTLFITRDGQARVCGGSAVPYGDASMYTRVVVDGGRNEADT
jgi:hypothetical protein